MQFVQAISSTFSLKVKVHNILRPSRKVSSVSLMLLLEPHNQRKMFLTKRKRREMYHHGLSASHSSRSVYFGTADMYISYLSGNEVIVQSLPIKLLTWQ